MVLFLVVILLAAVTIGLVFSTLFVAPSQSYQGPPVPLTEKEKELAERLRKHVQELAGVIGARSLTRSPDGLEKAAIYIEGEFQKMGYRCQHQEIVVGSAAIQQRERAAALSDHQFSVQGKSCRNIVAFLPGSKNDESTIVIGAHYDSVYDCPAANDNATGVAAMLELARNMCHEKVRKPIEFVAFVNEEMPFFGTPEMGSYHYAHESLKQQKKIDAMYSLETMGYFTDQPGTQKYPAYLGYFYPSTGNFIAFVGNLASSALVHKSVNIFRSAVKFPSQGLAAPQSVHGVGNSDQQPFWSHGYPGVMVTDTAFMRYPFYHTSADTPDKIDYAKLSQVVSGLTVVAQKLAAAQ